MSADNRYSGEITITPPLNTHEIRQVTDSYDWSIGFDAHLRVNRDEATAVEGESVLIYITETADAILGPEESCSGYDVVEQIQTVVDLFPDRAFAGWIEMDPDPGYGDPVPTRYVVRDRHVVEVRPVLAWPEDAS